MGYLSCFIVRIRCENVPFISTDVNSASTVPLHRRILRTQDTTCHARDEEQRRDCRRVWNKGEGEARMELALRDINSGTMTVRKAALVYGIPKSTLHDHASGKVRPGAGVGLPRYLNNEEEDELVRWLEGCAEVGCAKSVRQVRAVVGAIVAKKQGVDSAIVSHGWWDRFRQRHPHLTLRAGESLAYRRAVAANPDTFRHYFDQLENVLDTNGLRNAPSRIFNADESGMPLQHRPGRRIAVRGQKHVIVHTSGNKTQITVLVCVSARGNYIPPMVVFKRKGLTEDLVQGEVPDTMYGLSSSGWMDGELFSQWFQYHFLKYAPSDRPILLMVDGHSSHYNPQVIREAARSGVILFCLPPNVTHVAQPLDVTPFNSLKVHWDHVCDQFMSYHPGKIVTIHDFSRLFSQAWHQAMVPTTILAGFRATGIYPFNRQAITISGSEKEIATPTAKLAQRRGIRYLPFFSPHPNKSGRRPSQQEQFSDEGLWLHEQDDGLTPLSSPTSDVDLPCRLSLDSPPLVDLTPSSKASDHEPLWKEFLTVPSPVYKKSSAPGRARVLTSAAFMQQLAEKEQKKQKAAEEKERRKQQREEKRALKEKEKAAKQKRQKSVKKGADSHLRSHVPQQPTFSEEEEHRFERRYEEGYDLPDPRYLQWLQQRTGGACDVSTQRVKRQKSAQSIKEAAVVSPLSEVESGDSCKYFNVHFRISYIDFEFVLVDEDFEWLPSPADDYEEHELLGSSEGSEFNSLVCVNYLPHALYCPFTDSDPGYSICETTAGARKKPHLTDSVSIRGI